MKRAHLPWQTTRLCQCQLTPLGLVMAFHSPHLPPGSRKMSAMPLWSSCLARPPLKSYVTHISDTLPGCMSRPYCSFTSSDKYHSRYTPITEQDFYETIFRYLYEPELHSHFEPQSSQNLGVFCMILAIGTLVDLDKPAHSAESMYYYHLARAALSIDSILEEQTIAGIQALVIGSLCFLIFPQVLIHLLLAIICYI